MKARMDYNLVTDRILKEAISQHRSGENLFEVARGLYVNVNILSYRMKSARYDVGSRKFVDAIPEPKSEKTEAEMSRKEDWDKIIYNKKLGYSLSHEMPDCSVVGKKHGCKSR